MACILLCTSVWFYTVDDAFITFRYARNVVDGYGPVFNVGLRVEGFSSPLWLALLSLASISGLPIEAGAKLIGLLVAIGLLCYLGRRVTALTPAAQVPLLLLATHGPFVVAIVSGLETAVNAVLIVCLLLSSHVEGKDRRPAWLGTAFWGSLAILCRPENALLVGIHGLYLWSARPNQRRRLYVAAVTWLAVAGVLAAARLAYYGSLLPNTAVAKLDAEAAFGIGGWRYAQAWFERFGWLTLLGLPAVLTRIGRGLAANAWLLIGGQTVFVLLAGGDWMPLWRFMLPAGLLLLVVGCYSVDAVVEAAGHLVPVGKAAERAAGRVAAAACALVLAGLMVTQAWHFRQDRWALDSYQRQLNGLAAGPVQYLAAHAGPKDLVVARDIGVLGFETRCRVLDVVGLTDPHVARTSGLRHRDRIDCDYVFSLKPEYLVLQSEKDELGTRLDRIARVLVQDARFGRYEMCGRWEMPGGHFCELWQRAVGPGSARVAATTY